MSAEGIHYFEIAHTIRRRSLIVRAGNDERTFKLEGKRRRVNFQDFLASGKLTDEDGVTTLRVYRKRFKTLDVYQSLSCPRDKRRVLGPAVRVLVRPEVTEGNPLGINYMAFAEALGKSRKDLGQGSDS